MSTLEFASASSHSLSNSQPTIRFDLIVPNSSTNVTFRPLPQKRISSVPILLPPHPIPRSTLMIPVHSQPQGEQKPMTKHRPHDLLK